MSQSPLEGQLGDSLLKVVRGTPTTEELAAIAVVLTTLARVGADPEPEPTPAPALWDRSVDCSPVSWSARR